MGQVYDRGLDWIRRFERHLPLIGHVQIAAVPSRQEPDEGEINYPVIFEMLDRIGYKSWVGCEYRPRGKTEDGLSWARAYGNWLSAQAELKYGIGEAAN
jgi:hydroxypyruvate isomerase